MDKLIAIEPMFHPYVNITWQVNDFCNFKCKYCNPGNWAGMNPKRDKPEDFEKIKESRGNLGTPPQHSWGRGLRRSYFPKSPPRNVNRFSKIESSGPRMARIRANHSKQTKLLPSSAFVAIRGQVFLPPMV